MVITLSASKKKKSSCSGCAELRELLMTFKDEFDDFKKNSVKREEFNDLSLKLEQVRAQVVFKDPLLLLRQYSSILNSFLIERFIGDATSWSHTVVAKLLIEQPKYKKYNFEVFTHIYFFLKEVKSAYDFHERLPNFAISVSDDDVKALQKSSFSTFKFFGFSDFLADCYQSLHHLYGSSLAHPLPVLSSIVVSTDITAAFDIIEGRPRKVALRDLKGFMVPESVLSAVGTHYSFMMETDFAQYFNEKNTIKNRRKGHIT